LKNIEKLLLLLILCFAVSSDIYAENSNSLFIREIRFSGNKNISTANLLKIISIKPSDEISSEQIFTTNRLIEQYYNELNFQNVKIYTPEIIPVNGNIVDVLYRIEEPDIGRIVLEINGNSYLSKEFLKDKIPELAAEMSWENLQRITSEILNLYLDNGFLFAEVSVDSLAKYKDILQVFMTINENKSCRFTNFRFQGNKITKPGTILKTSGIKYVKVFNLNTLNLLEENLRKKEYIDDCSLIPLNHDILLFNIVESKMTFFAGLLGYDNSSKEKSLTGYMKLRFENLFGTDRSLKFYWSHLTNDRNLVELKYYDSGPEKYPIGAEILLSREEADSTFIRTIADMKLFLYTLNSKYGIYTGLNNYFPGSRRPILIEKYNQKKAGAFLEYSNTDNFPNPSKGYNISMLHYWIFEKDSEGSKIRNATEMSLATFFPLYKRFVLASILNIKNQSFKENNQHEYFSLGGASNLRGFTEDRFKGYRIFWVNNEIRYILNRKSRVFAFCDYGYLEMEDLGKRFVINNLFGIGLGLRYQTKIGLLGIDYGFGSVKGVMSSPWDGIIHFAIETGF